MSVTEHDMIQLDLVGELFEQALATGKLERWPFELALVHLAYGEHLRRAQLPTLARTHLEAASEIFQRLGVHPWASRADQELRATGQTRIKRDDVEVAALTPQEREVAGMAATGLSNKQIGARLYLSHRTVATHLYRVFPKLGIASRAGLRDALARELVAAG